MVEKNIVLNVFRGTVASMGGGFLVLAAYQGLLSWRSILIFGAMIFVGVFPVRVFRKKKAESITA
jgi:hypothetical protein